MSHFERSFNIYSSANYLLFEVEKMFKRQVGLDDKFQSIVLFHLVAWF